AENVDLVVVTGEGDVAAARRERAHRAALGQGPLLDDGAVGGVPPDGEGRATRRAAFRRNERLAVRREGDGIGPLLVLLLRPEQLAPALVAEDVEDVDGAVDGAGSDMPAVRGERYAPHRPLHVKGDGGVIIAAAIPDPDGAVPAAAGQPLA